MFCTNLRRRPSLSTLIPLLTSSTNPKLHETALQTHDLALPTAQPSQPTHRQPNLRPPTHPFLILTPSSSTSPTLTTERINRFTTLTATPAPTILFLLTTTSSQPPNLTGLQSFMDLQTLTHALPTTPPLLPIPSPIHLLPTLRTYTTAPTPSVTPITTTPLSLLPHLTTTAPLRPLTTHTANVLSDLCHSIVEIAVLGETEGGREMLGRWLGEEEGRGVVEFWEGEWIVE
ncbi:hypothetical protein BDR22DRAFT_338551 [Usnea florida]